MPTDLDQPENRPVHRRLRGAAVTLSLGVVTLFVGSALLLAGPTTPLTFRFAGPVSTVMLPHFPQNWSLFAPDPLSEERGFAARFRCEDGSETKFEDVTTEVITALQRQRVFPSRESRIIGNGILERFKEDPILKDIRAEGDERVLDSTTAEEITAEETEAQERAQLMLARYSVGVRPDACGGDAVRAVELRYVFHVLPGWSSRRDLSGTGDVTYFDSGWTQL